MSLKVCKCGALVKGNCPKCKPTTHTRTTKERGYGSDWRRLSERYRANNPLCEECFSNGKTTPAAHVHHIVPIARNPSLRLVVSNLMSVCVECHEMLEAAATPGGG